MTTAVVQIFREVGRLSEGAQSERRRALLERVPMSPELTDNDFAALAAASFKAFDAEEDASGA